MWYDVLIKCVRASSTMKMVLCIWKGTAHLPNAHFTSTETSLVPEFLTEMSRTETN